MEDTVEGEHKLKIHFGKSVRVTRAETGVWQLCT